MIRFFKRIHWSLYILLGYAFTFVVSILLFAIAPDGSDFNPISDKNTIDIVFVRYLYFVFIAPFVETIIFQLAPFLLLRFILKGHFRFWSYILLSAFLFSLNHPFGDYYIILTFIIGAVLAFLFYVAKLRRQNALLLVSVIHAINNLLAELGV